MFEAIGTLHSYAQQQNLLKSVNHKKKTGVSLDQLKEQAKEIARQNDSLVDKMLQAQKSADDEAAKQRIASIKNRLLAGKKLSQTEIDYLRDKDPKLYKKAKSADDARTELKAALKRAKTKQEARMALTQAMVKASSEALTEISAAKANMNAAGASGNVGNDLQNDIQNDLSNQNQTSDQNSSLIDQNQNLESNQTSEPNSEQSNTVIFAQTSSDQTSSDEIKMEIAGENLEESNEIQNEEQNSEVENLDETPESEETSEIQKSREDEIDTPEDIMEKYIMIFRALENEFVEFMKTDHAKKLPEDKPKDVVKIPSTKLHDMMNLYRMQMNFGK
ncbi:MAG: hypothetical protein IJ575_11825 [Selenomonadaceae bacterium]|nr:hypothetical protein [Selenomonadaceae bacterium]